MADGLQFVVIIFGTIAMEQLSFAEHLIQNTNVEEYLKNLMQLAQKNSFGHVLQVMPLELENVQKEIGHC